MLPPVWKSDLPFKIKWHSTFHLTNNIVFPFILIAGILNISLMYIKHSGGYDAYFDVMSVFVFAFIGSFLFYMYSRKKDILPGLAEKAPSLPLFMAGSMGFAVNNSRAVMEGGGKRKSDFVRTPKYSIMEKGDSWLDKKYVPMKFNWTVLIEIALAVYCLFGVISSLYYLEIAAVPFQLLFLIGFGFVSYLSIQQALQARRLKAERRTLPSETAAAHA